MTKNKMALPKGPQVIIVGASEIGGGSPTCRRFQLAGNLGQATVDEADKHTVVVESPPGTEIRLRSPDGGVYSLLIEQVSE